MYVNVCIYMRVFVNIYIYIHIYVCECVCMYVYVCACLYRPVKLKTGRKQLRTEELGETWLRRRKPTKGCSAK